MARAARRSRAGTGFCFLLSLWAVGRAAQPPPEAPRPDLNVRVVVLEATGRAEKPQFDPKTPGDLRKLIEGLNLAYGKYAVLDIHRRPARFAAEVSFDLPDKQTLVVRPFADEARPNYVRLGCRLLDGQKKPILINTMRMTYETPFPIHRPRGPANGLLMGVSAHKPAPDGPSQ